MSAAAVKRDAGSAAPERSTQGLRPPLAPGSGGVPGAASALCYGAQAKGCIERSTTGVDHIVPHRGDQKLFWDGEGRGTWAALCKRCHDAKTARESRWGSAEPPHLPGRGSFVYENGQQGPGAGRALCVAAKFRRGVSGR